MEEFLEELKVRGVERTETRKVDEKTGEETVGWSYKSRDPYGKSRRKRRRRASNLADDLTREGIEAYFEEKQRELEAQNRPDEQLAKLREDVDAARREFHASKEARDTLQSPYPGLLAGMHVFAKAGCNAKDPVSRMMADMTALMLRMMIQEALDEEARRQREEAERRVYESPQEHVGCREAPQGSREGAVQRGRAREAFEERAHAAPCQGGRAACAREDAEVGGQGHAVRRVAEKMREQRQAAPFLKLPFAGYKKTFKRAVDGRTRKGRKIGGFRRPLIYETDSENAGNGRSEARA